MIKYSFCCLLLLAIAGCTISNTPKALIYSIYTDEHTQSALLEKPQQFFIPPALDVLQTYETCFDLPFMIDGQDFDKSEILNTLDITEETLNNSIYITAYFNVFKKEKSVQWHFKNTAHGWRIYDITTRHITPLKWQLSSYSCDTTEHLDNQY